MNILDNSQEQQTEWFGEWFDSTYYHLLYQHRNDSEAQVFIDNIAQLLQFSPKNKVLDLACGRGRHAIYLSQKELQEVIGLDLAENNILFAKQFETENLKFFRHDMREVFRENYFDFILNMFTSFGYLENDQDNLKVLQAAAKNLKTKGKLVIDFLNPIRTLRDLVHHELKTVEMFDFKIQRYIENGFIIKEISFYDKGKPYRFFEKVRAFNLEDFQRLFSAANLEILHIFGNYALEPIAIENSERMIFIVEKQ